MEAANRAGIQELPNVEQLIPAVMIAATFTAEPLLPYLQLVLQEAGLAFDVRCAAYNQIFQELLSPNSSLAANAKGVGVALVRLEDFVRETKDTEEALVQVQRTAAELTDALVQYARRVKAPTLTALLAPSPHLPERLRSAIVTLNAALALRIEQFPGIQLLSCNLACPHGQEQYDILTDNLAHIPFGEDQYAEIALAIARKVHTLRVPAHKVLVLDCDNTLWEGVVGEDGVAGLAITPGRACLQRFAAEQQKQGTLLCLVSKNIENDVREVFVQRSDMILQAEQIVATHINWKPKPTNLSSLARTLNLGLDAFVFIDDNPVECAQMRTEIPDVVTLQLPPDDQIERFLTNLWTFDRLTITDEDRRRTKMYRENAGRRELEESATNILEFIASLNLAIEIRAPIDDEWARSAQLTQRTNQFNLTARRYTEADMRELSSEGKMVWGVNVRDRFGDYGLVGVVIASEAAGALAVDTFLLSCRVLGRGVEHEILRKLAETAKQRNLQRVDLAYIAAPKNEPARIFLENIARVCRTAEKGQVIYAVPTEIACTVAYQPDRCRAITNDEVRPNPSTSQETSSSRSERYEKLATVLTSGAAVVDAVRRSRLQTRVLQGPAATPACETERRLLLIWRELLLIEHIGADDNYFDLGGTSLLSVRLIATITRQFGVTLPLTSILEAPTIRQLARRIDYRPVFEETASVIELKPGGSRYLFLIHDGDGEILLYRNLANRMPDDITVCGILPRAEIRVPLAHTTIQEMARFYIDQIRAKQPQGPYLLGGMCAGGVIAYEMAWQLVRFDESIALVALLDAARPGAAKKPGRLRKERLGRLRSAVVDQQSSSFLGNTKSVIRTVSQKASKTLCWEMANRRELFFARLRFYLLAFLLRHNHPWPSLLPKLSVRQIYDLAESRYRAAEFLAPFLVLIRATRGQGDDTPYREIYADESLGWEAVAKGITVVDVEGGHSSMLQEQFVASIAAALTPYLLNGKP